MSEDNKKDQQQVQVKVSDGHRPVFSNSAQINVADDEVTLQFLYVRRNTGQGTLMSEVVLSPQHAIKFQKALDDTLKKHFTKHLPK
jgi:hypothetical protein